MREIKFRVFDKRNKKMITNEVCYQLAIGLNGSIKTGISEDVLMQYTGLKDKNGKEIYEGDIVKYKEWKNNSDELAFKTNYIVCFEQLKWNLKHSSGRYQVTVQQNSGLDSQSLNNDGCKARNFKIIGNIYENTELLQSSE
jgi:uncharacterized phage protein (TIGR01671 family)